MQYAENEIVSLKHQLESDRPSENVINLQGQLTSAHKDINAWKAQFNAERNEIVGGTKMLGGKLREWESRSRSLEDEIRRLETEKLETEERLNSEINQLKEEIHERDGHIENLNKTLDSLKLERDNLIVQVTTLKADVISREDRIDQMDKHLQQLHMEHVKLITSAEGARKLAVELRSKVKDLEEEVERQRVVIVEGAEEKREAIRQLCFSLEHYRNGYHRLRQAFVGHKRVPVLAA
ncbi:hypothetical protein GH714_043157 [Hevea brasiliensis]|uniref:NAB domain-containing protein n=1 Tax=Hevea brasiliensis TaxID=3981 RepID=A0A6A6K1T0_HEVBR|nr:hypothetical protein GH714_043157 [Hevea brasiliensis]